MWQKDKIVDSTPLEIIIWIEALEKKLLTCKLHELVKVLNRKYWVSQLPGGDNGDDLDDEDGDEEHLR